MSRIAVLALVTHLLMAPALVHAQAPRVTYSNVNAKTGFLAAYAGDEEKEARDFLEKVRALGRFPGANLRRMEAIFVYP